jgi:mono/diheme cytochrome c family protein
VSSLRSLSWILFLGLAGLAFAGSAPNSSKPAVSRSSLTSAEVDQQWALEGERRYRSNCGRCHQAPHRFPSRTMATVIRHMRVRAMLTDDDMKYVLYYMTH